MGLQAIVRWLIPREDGFYGFLERQAVVAHEGATALARSGVAGATVEQVRSAVQEAEHRGDAIVHAMEEALARTFVTPIDREDLQKLSSAIDDVLDLANGAARGSALMGVERPSAPMRLLMQKLVECTAVLAEAMPLLRKHAYAELIEASRTLRRLEKDADVIYRDAVHALFHDGDGSVNARVILREKSILEDLERAIDHCELVGDALANLAVKHG